MTALGLDVGTSAVKGIVLDRDGRVLATARHGYRLELPAPGRVEVSAERVWAATATLIARLAAKAERAGSPIVALAVSGSGDEVVAVDTAGAVTGPVIVALDTRAARTARTLEARFGAAWLYGRTGLAAIGMAPLTRLVWLRQHDPAQAARIDRLLAWPELVALRLGVEPRAEPSLAGRTLGYDLRTDRYAEDILGPLNVDAGVFAPVVPSGTRIGEVAAGIAERLGLPRGTAVVTGGFDQAMATLGAGALAQGVAHVGFGSWQAVTALLDAPLIDERLRLGGWSVGRSVGGTARYAAMASWVGGAALRWVARLCADTWPGGAAPSLPRLLREAPDGPARLLALSHLVGAASPEPDGAARGAFVGLDLGATRGELTAAIVESVTFQLRGAIDQLEAAGVRVHTLRATGGGARSRGWLQRTADITGRIVERSAVADSGAFAAALVAGAAMRVLPPAADAVRMLMPVALRLEPRHALAERYAQRAGLQRRLDTALRDWGAAGAAALSDEFAADASGALRPPTVPRRRRPGPRRPGAAR